ncbi:MAG: OmpA family protein [Pseudomonadales bacterium]|nr:OmpA family protein [Pseudomonadales bacterium]
MATKEKSTVSSVKNPGKPKRAAKRAQSGAPLVKRASMVFLFAEGSATLAPSEESKVGPLVTRLRRNPDAILVIRGHTLGRGADAGNRALGLKRARAVARAIVGRGIAARRVIAVTLGRRREFEQLLPDERRQRRRADVSVYSGNVVELRGPDLVMEARVSQRPRARRVA